MLSLYVIANILFIAFVGASVANFYDDCLQEGMIFSFIGKFVKDKFWLKPLGGCIICTNVWITFLMSILYLFFPVIFIVFAVLGISNTCLKFIIK